MLSPSFPQSTRSESVDKTQESVILLKIELLCDP